MAKIMIVTVGTGPNVEHGICCSIKTHNPDEVKFFVTERSREKTLHKILQNEVMSGRNSSELLLKNPEDFEEIEKETENEIRRLKCCRKDIVIDFTSGTKAMSAGVTIAGVKMKVGGLVYVSGKRNEQGTVISGTERIITIEPHQIYADDLWRKAVESFNGYQFDACIKNIEEADSLIAGKEFQQKLSTLKVLAEAYSAWDRFRLREAFEKLGRLAGNKLLPVWKIKSRVEDNKDILFQEKENDFCKERMVDLIENAKRRSEEEKFDDAVARLYRTIEYIGQYKIKEKGLFNERKGKPQLDDLNIEKLPVQLREKYLKLRGKPNGKIELGLYKLYELLSDIDEPVGKHFEKDTHKGDSKIKKILYIRNHSILAHGFFPVKESEFKEMLSSVQDLVKIVLQNYEDFSNKAKFPRINL